MATMISQLAFNLIQSTCLSSPSSQRLLYLSQSSSLSFDSVRTTRFSKPRKQNQFLLTASTSSVAAVSDDISHVLGDVSIFIAAGEPVKFKNL